MWGLRCKWVAVLENRIEARTQEIRTINKDLQAQIDSRVQTEQALTLAKKEAEQANDSKTRFLALASHDILQPLNAARLYLAAIDDKTLSSNNLNNFEKLGASLDSTVHLMSALLEIAKLEQGDEQERKTLAVVQDQHECCNGLCCACSRM